MAPKRERKPAGWTGWEAVASDDEERYDRELRERQAANGFGLPAPEANSAAARLTRTRRRTAVPAPAPPIDEAMDVDQESTPSDDDAMDIDDQESVGSDINVSQRNATAAQVPLNNDAVSDDDRDDQTGGSRESSVVSDVPTLDDRVNLREEEHDRACNDPIVERLHIHFHDKLRHLCSDPKHEGPQTITCDQCFEVYEEDRTILTEQECWIRDEGAFMSLCQAHADEIKADAAVILCTCRLRHSRQTVCTTCSTRHTKRLARAYRKENRRHVQGRCHQCQANESGSMNDGICAYCGGSKRK